MRRITSCTTFFFEWTFEWTTLPKVAGGDFSFLRIDGWFRALWRGVVGDRLQRLFSAHGREGLGKNLRIPIYRSTILRSELLTLKEIVVNSALRAEL